MIEYILALAVGLQIRRRGRHEVRRVVLDEDRRGSPAGPLPHAPGGFERREEGMTDERVVACNPVPGVLVEPAYARRELGDDFTFTVGHRPPR